MASLKVFLGGKFEGFLDSLHHAWCVCSLTPCMSKIAHFWSSEAKWKKGDCYWVVGGVDPNHVFFFC